jgi:uncharacterized damage-inducible protein DinB
MLNTSGNANTAGVEFIEASRIALREDFLPKLRLCLDGLSDADIWWRPNDSSNSAGNLVLHLCGNLRQWIVDSIGGVRFERHRDAEFSERGPLPKADLIATIEAAVGEVEKVLECLDPDGLMDRVAVQGYTPSRLQAVYHVVEHFSYHLGQILYIYKMRTGRDPGFYSHLAGR